MTMNVKILLLGSGILLGACESGPNVVVCLSSPEKGGFICADKEDKIMFLDYKDSTNYVAHSPDDYQKLIEYCRRQKEDSFQ